MLEEKDLQAIAQMMDSIKKDITQEASGLLTEQRKGIMQDVTTLMDADFSHRFDLLAEGQQTILEKLERLEDMDIMDTRLTALEAMVKKLNREVNQLKKAQ